MACLGNQREKVPKVTKKVKLGQIYMTNDVSIKKIKRIVRFADSDVETIKAS